MVSSAKRKKGRGGRRPPAPRSGGQASTSAPQILPPPAVSECGPLAGGEVGLEAAAGVAVGHPGEEVADHAGGRGGVPDRAGLLPDLPRMRQIVREERPDYDMRPAYVIRGMRSEVDPFGEEVLQPVLRLPDLVPESDAVRGLPLLDDVMDHPREPLPPV